MNINPKVVDISHYDDVEYANGEWIGFKKLRAAGYVGVINKVTQGRGMIDVSYRRRREGALDAGLLWGAYHYLDGSDPAQQATHFLAEARPDFRTLIALDHEQRGVPLSAAERFCRTVYAAIGRYPFLYSGFLIKEQMPSDGMDDFWQQIPLWLSHYSSTPKWPSCWKKPTLWQFTGDGVGPGPHQVPGISIPGGCDINSFDGTDDELAKVWAA